MTFEQFRIKDLLENAPASFLDTQCDGIVVIMVHKNGSHYKSDIIRIGLDDGEVGALLENMMGEQQGYGDN